MKKEQQCVETRIARIEQQLSSMPEGKLICAKNGRGYKWYVSDGHRKVYIPKEERSLAEKLAQKKYLSTILDDLKCKKKALEQFLKSYAKGKACSVQDFMENKELCNLLGGLPMMYSIDMMEWMNEPYERSKNHPEHLVHKTPWGEVFRSKSESMIAMCLRERGIPYRYECALMLGGETIYPDFMIRHPRTGKIFYYEHYGRMDDHKYVKDNLPKLQLYTSHGIIPGIHLILSFETKDAPLSMYTIECLLEQYFS